NSRIRVLVALTAIFACSTIFLLFRLRGTAANVPPALTTKPALHKFWSQIFRPEQHSDIVLDDAELALYQELTNRQIPLSEYFDRSYLRKLDHPGVTELNRNLAGAMMSRRHSNYGTATVLWNLSRIVGPLQSQVAVYFARDYTFRELKADNVILLGNSRSNPWIESLENRLGVRWHYDESMGAYYPVDTLAGAAAQGKFLTAKPVVEPREGYAMVSLLPNLSGAGNVLIIS